MKKFTAALSVSLAAATLVACAFSPRAEAVGRLADVQVYDRTEGRTLPVYYFEGRHYIIGHPGNEYQINLRSRTGERLLAVASVDGVNVITGETASPDQSGYVLTGRGVTDVRGWRKSENRIAAFYFTAHQNSYAARTGRPMDVGVIGVAVFRERYRSYPQYDYRREPGWEEDWRIREKSGAQPPASAAPAPQDSGKADAPAKSAGEGYRAEPKLGTGHGRSEWSSSRETRFERASSSPDEVIAIYYDSYQNLVAQGVIPSRRYEPSRPQPFPGEDRRFTPDPPPYRW